MSNHRPWGSSLVVFVVCAVAASVCQAQPVPVPINNTCKNPPPPLPCRAATTCRKNGDSAIWVLGAPLKKGTFCAVGPGGSVASTCDGNGNCTPPVPGPSGTMYPVYYLLAVIYAPPGNKSKVSYTSGSTLGTTSDIGSSVGTGVTVGVVGNVVLTNNYQLSYQNDQTVQFTKTTGSGIDLYSVNDGVDHTQDLFYIWTNPAINYSQPYKAHPAINVNFGINGTQGMQVNHVSAAQLMGTVGDPDGVLTNFSAADKANLLAQDPFLTKGYSLDPNRFVFVQEVQLEGPPAAGQDYPGTPIPIGLSSTTCNKSTVTSQDTVSFGAQAGADFFGEGEHFEVIGSFTWKETGSWGTCNGQTQNMTADLVSTTAKYNHVIQVYQDSLFSTFAFVDTTAALAAAEHTPLGRLSGVVLSAAGQALPNQQINVTFANGVTRTLFSDANGNYTVIGVPPGEVTIATGDLTQKATVVSGQATEQKLTVKDPTRKLNLPGFVRTLQ